MRTARIPGFVRIAATAAAFALAAFAGTGAARADDTAQPVIYRQSQSVSDIYHLGNGDKLRMIVYGEDDLGGTFDVDGNGVVSLPLIGPVKVAGLSVNQVEQTVTGKYADGYLKEPRVNVEVVQFRPVYMLGEVNKPGSFPYVDGMTLQNAVATAGGYTQKAIESGYYVRHVGDAQETYVEADGTTKVLPGDTIRIDSSFFWDAMSIVGPLSGLAYTFR